MDHPVSPSVAFPPVAANWPSGARCVVHMDLDCFYASVEELQDPSLRGRPIAVVMGLDAQGHGAVATASYAARAFGVHSAMSLLAARQICPQLVVLPVRHALYRQYSAQVMGMLRELSPLMQQISIDEAFVELTGQDDVLGRVEAVRQRITEGTGLSCSFGIAANRLVAKIATGQGKPRGFVVVPPGTEAPFLAPLPTGKLWGVGPRTQERLRELAILTLGDLAQADPMALSAVFGARRAQELHSSAQGMDDRPLDLDTQLKSISAEQTLGRGEADARRLWVMLQEMAQDVSYRLRQRELVARTIGIKLRLLDGRLLTRDRTLPQPVDDPTAIAATAAALMRAHWRRGTPLRLLGLRVSNLGPCNAMAQLALFLPDALP
jgi:DNA polymerase-4